MKAKAPVWLRESFRDGVGELAPPPLRAYPGAISLCYLSRFDPLQRPCAGRIERFHIISRQRVENAIWDALPFVLTPEQRAWRDEIILRAAWDPRNGGFACAEEHHARFDLHRGPALELPREALPDHVLEFASDYGLESWLPDGDRSRC